LSASWCVPRFEVLGFRGLDLASSLVACVQWQGVWTVGGKVRLMDRGVRVLFLRGHYDRGPRSFESLVAIYLKKGSSAYLTSASYRRCDESRARGLKDDALEDSSTSLAKSAIWLDDTLPSAHARKASKSWGQGNTWFDKTADIYIFLSWSLGIRGLSCHGLRAGLYDGQPGGKNARTGWAIWRRSGKRE
jgi:hypothetical protein